MLRQLAVVLTAGALQAAATFAQPAGDSPMKLEQADAFAQLAMSCIHQQYPNQISHHVKGKGEMAEPRSLYPSFYGCFDWHSAVHGHWLLVRLLHLEQPGLDRSAVLAALNSSFSADKLAAEAAYFQPDHRKGFERPYGRAWLLQLTAELREWDSPESRAWLPRFAALEAAIIEQTMEWLPNLSYPVRSGTHNQTAFAFGLMLDAARKAGWREFEQLLVQRSLALYATDRECPLAYEPSGEDFLSPCLMEADLMRRVLSPKAFSEWLTAFLPMIPRDGSGDWLEVAVVLDPTDGKLVHLDGLNLSRAWALEMVAAALPDGDARQPALLAASARHARSGLAAVSSDHYEGSHWLASFATYLVTQRGL